jgi:antitoxin component of RelBE/YafQ-DinJ toxin-antitoxin module
MKEATLYKWMIGDFESPIQHTIWPVAPEIWTPMVTPVLCRSGWHGMLEKDVLAHLPSTTKSCTLWEVEIRGKRAIGDDKLVGESMRLLHKVGVTTEENLRLFAADCAEDVLPLFLRVRPDDDRPARAIEAARAYARGEITDAARYAARDAARYAARAAARGAAGDAARAAAGYAARAAARDVARAAARYAARGAAGDAARAKYSNWLVVRVESGY